MSAIRSRRATVVPGAATFALCALLVAAPVAGVAASGGSPEEDPERDAGLGDLSEAIESAFRLCDVEPLRTAFSRNVKTLLSSRTLGVRQGYYGADQVLLILRRGFRSRTTVRFKLGDRDDAVPQSERRLLSARWLYRDEGDSKSEARLSFTLARDGPAWHIREIRELK